MKAGETAGSAMAGWQDRLRLGVTITFAAGMLMVTSCGVPTPPPTPVAVLSPAVPTMPPVRETGAPTAAPSPAPTDVPTARLPSPTVLPSLPPSTHTAPPPPTETYTPTPAPTQTPAPTATPAPAPTRTPTSPPPTVSIRRETVTIATYPYAQHIAEAWNPTFHMSYAVLDRAAYAASSPAPAPVTYSTLVMENEALKLAFLPDLGGRIYEVVFKPTGHRVTYRNPVLKPSPWGPPEQGWWLAAGGIEWCFPVEEHGYEWGVPWSAEHERDGLGVTITLCDTQANDRVRAQVQVRLENGAGYFTIRPRLENPTGTPVAVKFWTNAMLAPGGQNAPSADLRFVLSDSLTAVTVHSRGDDWLPDYNQRMSWPVYSGVDFGRLGNWNRWLGFFEDPALGGFMAVYDGAYDEGMVRLFPAKSVPGAKGFAFGWSDPIPNSDWTDDDSRYVEMQSGPAPNYDDSVVLPAGGHLEWTETWYPVAGLGGLKYANEAAALYLEAGGGQAQVSVAVCRPWSGEILLLLDGQERWRAGLSLLPGQSFRESIPLGTNAPQAGRLTLRLETADGQTVAEYGSSLTLR